MNLLTILHIINISVIMVLMCHLLIRIRGMKYSVYWSIMRTIRFDDRRGLIYLKQNWSYFIYMFFVVVLFFINITLIGQLLNNSIFDRPIFLLTLSPLAWGCVLLYFRYTYKKVL